MTRLRGEEGWAFVTAVVVMSLMLGMGLSLFAVVETQQAESGKERIRESSFGLTEGVLNLQLLALGATGMFPAADPAGTPAPSPPYPTECNQSSTSTRCPSPARVATSFDQPDFASGVTWQTKVRDNGPDTTPSVSDPPSGLYSGTVFNSQPNWDLNGDGRVWVRAQATVRGHTRAMVAMVPIEKSPVEFPRFSVLAGKFATSNNGNKALVDSGTSLGLAVRCSGLAPPASNPACLNYRAGQVQPAGNVQTSYPAAPAISPATVEELVGTARANGTYYTSCPDSPAGRVVVIDVPAGTTCTYGGNGTINTAASPGLIILPRGRISIARIYHGIIYAQNLGNETADMITTTGNSELHGAAIVDKNGGVRVGSSKLNIIYNPLAFDSVTTTRPGNIIQNSWREIASDG